MVLNDLRRNFIPERLREGREARGLTIQELSERVGVSHQSISKYENGKAVPSGMVFQKLLFTLNLPIHFFYKPIHRGIEDSVVFFRSKAATTSRSKKLHEIKINWLQDISVELEKILDFPKVLIPKINTSPIYFPTDMDDIDELAVEVRRSWGLGNGPISNVLLLVEKKGVIAARADFNDQKVDACSVWRDDQRPFILLGTEKSSVRSRFDVAHELGHLVLHSNLKRNEFEKNMKLIESEADRFASAFLMPVESFSSEFVSTSLEYLINLKKRWKVSIQAMAYRARDLDIISEFQYRNIMRKIGQNNWRKHEPLDEQFELEQPTVLKQAIKALIKHNVINKSDIERYLGLTKGELEIYANLETGTLSDKIVSDQNIIRFRHRKKMGM
ncbi:transcriptional regulator with an addtional conserved domain protein [Desmospora sp. 8437]|uniref:Transcriptional regulator n=1 Tax=Kroppenstedtia guangzhouensis TaxID=1274356 RepID=A0ABQ1GN39_9BACL|nr:transcriptional regulator with an addtional conserved domain protein [Desmospora sp. 8437]GGA47047.1 transcriptional regulator [Kroppenstedtia guangzhouensis]